MSLVPITYECEMLNERTKSGPFTKTTLSAVTMGLLLSVGAQNAYARDGFRFGS